VLPSEYVIPAVSVSIGKFANYSTPSDFTQYALEIVLAIIFVLYAADNLRKWMRAGQKFWKSGWSYFEIPILVVLLSFFLSSFYCEWQCISEVFFKKQKIFLVVVGLRIATNLLAVDLQLNPQTNEQQALFHYIMALQYHDRSMRALLAIALWIKLFKYFRIFKSIGPKFLLCFFFSSNSDLCQQVCSI
jgi:hypothetical protein